MHAGRLARLCPVLVCATLTAQTPAGPSLTAHAPAPREAAAARIELGRKTLGAGNAQDAVGHFLGALEFDPASSDVLRGLIDATSADDDARFHWALRWWLANADARGQAKPDRTTIPLLPELPRIREISKAKAAAIAELVRFVGKLKAGRAAPENGLVARWAIDLIAHLARDVPAQRRQHAAATRTAADRHEPDYNTVLNALKKLMSNPPRPGNEKDEATAQQRAHDLAMRAARILAGLAAQANFRKLEGPKPPSNIGRFGDAARDALAKLRAQVAARQGEPKTVAELEAMTPTQREAFTKAHGTWANPGVAISPTGKYRVETTCGFETLLGAAQTVEMHHARLANWNGKDPFTTQGTVRILPEFDGLESDGSPHWWAGGFQRGDLTTVRFAWSTISNLGRTLTHELTHRFDGRLYAFLPAWMIEGRAVWTASAYRAAEAEEFQARRIDPRTVQRAYMKGYGRVGKLEELIDGSIDDYRDNYTAGYALFVYLAMWEKNGTPIYADALQKFMRNARSGRKEPIEYFTKLFADGQGGRPADLAAFAGEFGQFLHGCYRYCWGERDQPWASRYQFGLHGKQPMRNKRVLDEPSWSWARDRAEPWFGQRHAALAGHLLAEVGNDKAALAALSWSLRTDGWHAPNVSLLAETAERTRKKNAAWVARHRLGQTESEAPMLRTLPKTRALLATLTKHATELRAVGQAWAAIGLDARAHDLAAQLGTSRTAPSPSPAAEPPLHPLVENPIALDRHGWLEGGLTGFEDRRHDGLWYETDTGDLHVGRAKPRDKSGLLDPRARQRHAFVRSAEWQRPGRYVFRTRVHFTTSYVSGALVLGYTRRDRNVRLHFSAGDFLFSVGRKSEVETTESVELRVDAKWERDGNLSRSQPHDVFEFEKPATSFGVELRVEGPTVHVAIDGQPRFSYTTPDGSPIEGHIGVAMGQGAVRLQQPRVQRLDRDEWRPAAADASTLLTSDTVRPKVDDWRHRTLHGVPTSRHGTIVIWVPVDDYAPELAGNAIGRFGETIQNTIEYPQHWVLALPATLSGEERKDFTSRWRELAPKRTSTITHSRSQPFEAGLWAMFVDAGGILRTVDEALGRSSRLPHTVRRWARQYRTRPH